MIIIDKINISQKKNRTGYKLKGIKKVDYIAYYQSCSRLFTHVSAIKIAYYINTSYI